MTPESTALWQEKVQPILSAFREHVTIDQIEKLHDEATRWNDKTPSHISSVIDTLYRLRLEIERL